MSESGSPRQETYRTLGFAGHGVTPHRLRSSSVVTDFTRMEADALATKD